jgi:AcrR family transcriptional regulator
MAPEPNRGGEDPLKRFESTTISDFGTAESKVRVIAHQQVLEAARQSFVREGRLDIQDLAQKLAVSRATLYRVVSSRERLLGDVLWSLAEVSLHSAIQETNGAMDLERLLRIGSRFRSSVLSSEALRTFVRAEPSTAAVALFTRGEMRDRVANEWRTLLLQATESRGSSLTIDASQAAEIIVSLGVSTLYGDLMTDHEQDTDLVAMVIRSLFSGPSPLGSDA